MIMNIIMMVTLYPTMLILCLVWKYTARSNKSMVYGVSLNSEQRADERLAQIDKNFDKLMRRIILLTLILPPFFFLLKHVSIQFTVWMIWFMGALVVINVPYALANKAAMNIKREWKAKKEAEQLGENDAAIEVSATGNIPFASSNSPAAGYSPSAGTSLSTGTSPSAGTSLSAGTSHSAGNSHSAGTSHSTGTSFAQRTQYFETTIIRTVKVTDFLPQLILSAACPIILYFAGPLFHLSEATLSMLQVYLIVTAVFAACTFLFYLVAVWMDRIRATVISSDSRINENYNRSRKNIWREIWKREAWLNTLVILVITIFAILQQKSFTVFMVMTILESILGILILLKGMRDIRQADDLYQEKKEETYSPDDDEFWIFGMFYNNPYDKRTMVPKRFGVGTTANMATNAGKATIWVAIAALIWIPIMCVWLILDDFTPMHLTITDDAVVCTHLRADYTIPLSSVENAELLTKLPESRYKVSGTGTDEMEKGRYSCTEYSTYYTFVRCENELFIKLETPDRIYVISGMTDAETESVFAEIEKGFGS